MARRTFGDELKDVLGTSKLSVEEAAKHPGVHREFQYLFAHEIIPGTYQPRQSFDQDSLQELSDSIKEKGILQPLIVRKSDKEYELIAGERRWRAAQLAGLKQIPVIVCEIDNNAALAFSLIENIQRQNLNPIEEATALKRLLEEFSMTHEEVAKSIGKSRALVSNTLRLLNLAEPVKEMLANRQIEMGHARAILSLSEEKQIEAAKIIVAKQMTVRGTEAFVRLLQTEKGEKSSTMDDNPRLLSLEKELCELFGLTAKIQVNAKGKGKFICHFLCINDLEKLIRQLRNDEVCADEA